MKNIGVLWDEEVEWDDDSPFENSDVGESYAYFSDLGMERGVKMFHARHNWYENGVLKEAWRFECGDWVKVEDVDIDGVFDKFHFDEETKELKREMNIQVGILNNPELEELCKDKLLTYERFSDMIPDTRMASQDNIQEMMDEYGKIVLKPRFAYGGKGIHILEKGEEIPDLDDNYLVQRFVDSSTGIDGVVDGSHDLRGIVVNGEILGGYVRYSEDGEISNVSQGGSQHAVDLDEFPDEAIEIIENVVDDLDFNPSFFSVDLFFDENSKAWIVELNSKPGLGFYGDEEMKRQLTPIMKSLTEAFKQI